MVRTMRAPAKAPVLPGFGDEDETAGRLSEPPRRIRWSFGERAELRLDLLDVAADPTQAGAEACVAYALSYLDLEGLSRVAGLMMNLVEG